jgi:hypothetical protein
VRLDDHQRAMLSALVSRCSNVPYHLWLTRFDLLVEYVERLDGSRAAASLQTTTPPMPAEAPAQRQT